MSLLLHLSAISVVVAEGGGKDGQPRVLCKAKEGVDVDMDVDVVVDMDMDVRGLSKLVGISELMHNPSLKCHMCAKVRPCLGGGCVEAAQRCVVVD